MPLVRSYAYEKLPAWAALKRYRKDCFHQGEAVEIELPYRRVAFVVLCGACEVEESGTKTLVRQYEVYESKTGSFTMHGVFQPPFYFIRNVDVLVIGGEWDGAEINLFMVNQSDCPENRSALGAGTPNSYYRNTNFDNHYHDFDEFWIVCEGSGVVQDNGSFYEVEEGDCVATGAGNHHDFPIVHSFVKALAIEMAPEPGKRHGHLWEQTHGKAVPDPSKA